VYEETFGTQHLQMTIDLFLALGGGDSREKDESVSDDV
jgi:hypothetical protein